ncbi:MAG: Rieske 2Fe-2S domain-containing protein [Planctomycetota bacterium]|nr:Rieske 2Fe-2S domain-containing protein [Planctomycetota bacterium]
MTISVIPVDDIREFGRAYCFAEGPFSGGIAVRVRSNWPGSVPDPRDTGWLIGFATTCPHMGCSLVSSDECLPDAEQPMTYAFSNYGEELVCGPCRCHGTTFDLAKSGLVVLGPSTQNLPQLELRVSPDRLALEAVGWWSAENVDPREEMWPTSIRGQHADL